MAIAINVPSIPPQAISLLDLRGAAPLLDSTGNPVPPPLMANQWWIPLRQLFSSVTDLAGTVATFPTGTVIFDTHANRVNYAASVNAGKIYFETDRYVLYGAASVPTSTVPIFTWIYMAGQMFATQATLPTDLGINDAEFLATVDDYGHILRWNISGTPHWEWAPGDPGSGMMQFFEVDPTGPGWHLYDGSSVSYLKSDGTLGGPITLPDLVSSPSYIKAGTPNTGVTAAVAPTITVEPITSTPSSTQVVQTGVGTTVAAQAHTHTLSGGTISSTGEPQSITRRPFFRM